MIDIRYVLLVREAPELRGVNYKTRLVLYALASRVDEKGFCFPSQAQIAEDTGLSIRGVQRGIQEAVGVGFLTVDNLFGSKTSRYTFPYVNNYKLNVHKLEAPRQVDVLTTKAPRQVGGHTASSRHGHHVKLADGSIPKKDSNKFLSLRQEAPRQVDGVGVDNFVGDCRPSSPEEVKTVEGWCIEAGLSPEKAREFIGINTRARWKLISAAFPIQELIQQFVEKWRNDHPDEYFYYQKCRRGEA